MEESLSYTHKGTGRELLGSSISFAIMAIQCIYDALTMLLRFGIEEVLEIDWDLKVVVTDFL
ncbi:hypothetical protein ACPUEN_00670 [Algoriphagus yeomjeoni]|uniref:hypothetical protein n=1 Tax=Algoriphagus yeomjeoni TaxID=291403 RepID=UPI003CE5C648